MAFGFTPKFSQEFPLNELTKEQFLAIAVETAKKLEWNIAGVAPNGLLAYTSFSFSSWSEEVKVVIGDESAVLTSSCTGNQLVDWGKNKKNIQYFIETFGETKQALTAEELKAKYEELNFEVAEGDESVLHETLLSTKERSSSLLAIFNPVEGYFITPIIINLNIAVFILMVLTGTNVFSPTTDNLLHWGANFRPMTLDGGWWRLFASIFIHIGVFHLLVNMFALFYIGLLLEPVLGRLRFTMAYLASGLAASIASMWWNDLTVSAGASGAIFGLYGVFVALLTTNLIEKQARKALTFSVVIFVGVNLLNGMKAGIDGAAHLGGLLSGLFIGYAFYPTLVSTENVKTKNAILALIPVLFLLASYAIYSRTPNNIAKYEKEMNEFARLENIALGIYKMPDNTPRREQLIRIKLEGINSWYRCMNVLYRLQKIQLPPPLRNRVRKLMDYCHFRVSCYNFIYKAVDENTDKYNDSIQHYDQLVAYTLQLLKANYYGGQAETTHSNENNNLP